MPSVNRDRSSLSHPVGGRLRDTQKRCRLGQAQQRRCVSGGMTVAEHPQTCLDGTQFRDNLRQAVTQFGDFLLIAVHVRKVCGAPRDSFAGFPQTLTRQIWANSERVSIYRDTQKTIATAKRSGQLVVQLLTGLLSKARKRPMTRGFSVGDARFELATSSVSRKRATTAPTARGGDGI